MKIIWWKCIFTCNLKISRNKIKFKWAPNQEITLIWPLEVISWLSLQVFDRIFSSWIELLKIKIMALNQNGQFWIKIAFLNEFWTLVFTYSLSNDLKWPFVTSQSRFTVWSLSNFDVVMLLVYNYPVFNEYFEINRIIRWLCELVLRSLKMRLLK